MNQEQRQKCDNVLHLFNNKTISHIDAISQIESILTPSTDAVSKDKIINRYPELIGFPLWYHKMNIEMMLDEYASQRTAELEAKVNELEGKVPKWISVEERLPEQHKDVLVYDSHDTEVRSLYFDGQNRFINLDKDDDRTEYIKKWMTLPKNPAQENKER